MLQTIDPQRWELLAEVASLYYEGGLDQEQVATRIGVSRSSVSRMLSEAQDVGVVEFRINRPLPLDENLQRTTIRKFPVRDALILQRDNVQSGEVLARVGQLVAQHLDANFRTGIPWRSPGAQRYSPLPRVGDPSDVRISRSSK